MCQHAVPGKTVSNESGGGRSQALDDAVNAAYAAGLWLSSQRGRITKICHQPSPAGASEPFTVGDDG